MIQQPQVFVDVLLVGAEHHGARGVGRQAHRFELKTRPVVTSDRPEEPASLADDRTSQGNLPDHGAPATSDLLLAEQPKCNQDEQQGPPQVEETRHRSVALVGGELRQHRR